MLVIFDMQDKLYRHLSKHYLIVEIQSQKWKRVLSDTGTRSHAKRGLGYPRVLALLSMFDLSDGGCASTNKIKFAKFVSIRKEAI